MAEPEWYARKCQEEQPGDVIGNCEGKLVRVINEPFSGTPSSPRQQFMRYVLAPALMIAFCGLLLLLHDIHLI